MIKLLAYIFIITMLPVSIANAQVTKKPNLYIFFKNDTTHRILKRVIDQQNIKTGKHYRYTLFDYFYNADDAHHYQFISKATCAVRIVDSVTFKKLRPQNLLWLQQITQRLPATYSKNFPYKSMYLVERLKPNEYSIVEVTSFIGKDF